MSYRHHILHNYTKNAGLFEKIKANILFLFGVTKITLRKNYLTRKDYKKSIKDLQKGDLLLVGTHQRLSALFIGGIVTHSQLYEGNGSIIHAVSDGVERMTYKKIFKEHDTLIILRPKKVGKKVEKVIEFARNQIGKPFDFDFGPGQKKYYCAELVNNAYHHAGFHTGVANHPSRTGSHTVLMPKDFLCGNFSVIFLSNSLHEKNGKIILNHKIYKNKILEKFLNN